MTEEDETFARKHKEWGLGVNQEKILDGIDLTEAQLESSADSSQTSSVDLGYSTQSSSTEEDESLLLVSCLDCGEMLNKKSFKYLSLFSKNDEYDDLAQLRLKAQHEGVTIEYRCPRCRQCTDCKRSFETERVSLREETEDFMVYESVQIDWEKKQIICSFPMRGSEEEFLSSNRDIALRVLDQQCNKYKNDTQTQEAIKKAFDKLIKNGQMVPFDSLNKEQKDTILAKQVNYWIPWRVVFKMSLSTPCRPVFDASSNTKPRGDGSGGRSLNDLVVKGRVVTLNLIRMLMRFSVGAAAVGGDLKQFYASIGLMEEF